MISGGGIDVANNGNAIADGMITGGSVDGSSVTVREKAMIGKSVTGEGESVTVGDVDGKSVTVGKSVTGDGKSVTIGESVTGEGGCVTGAGESVTGDGTFRGESVTGDGIV